MLKTWDSTIYSASVIINAILDHIQNGPPLSPEEKHTLYECLAVLYTNQHNYAEALTVYLELVKTSNYHKGLGIPKISALYSDTIFLIG